MIELKLTKDDYGHLCLLLGMATATVEKDDTALKELIDWILIQGHRENYTYWNDKDSLKRKKESELKNEKYEFSE